MKVTYEYTLAELKQLIAKDLGKKASQVSVRANVSMMHTDVFEQDQAMPQFRHLTVETDGPPG